MIEERIRWLIGSCSSISYTIRRMENNETALLDDFLYEDIFIPEGVEEPLKEIIKAPEEVIKDTKMREP